MSNQGVLNYRLPRRQMVERQIRDRGVKDQRVLDAMLKIPRHFFVEEALIHQAYGDRPLPIGESQTISQPVMVAQMTEALELKGNERVLEIGTGSGYQAAILAELAYRVYTIERFRSLMIKARQLLEGLGYRNIVFLNGDGTRGWAEQAPFEAIMVTAGAPDVPAPLVEQLAPGGRLVIPVGKSRMNQTLLKIVKDQSGALTEHNLGGCRFVDLVGQHGWTENG
ncbi:MAG: protein-L-isoaspartate(D-aspartate) O-methyltransferase [Pseudomonadota bacterium]